MGGTGELHPANRRGGSVHGRPAVSSCADLPPGGAMAVALDALCVWGDEAALA